MRGLQTANPFPLVLVHETNEFPRHEAVQIERLIHARLAPYNSSGEWFECGPDLVLRAMMAIGSELRDPGDVV